MKKINLSDTFYNSFNFLWNEFGFKINNDKKEEWGYRLDAKNDTTGIRIEYEYREAFISITLYKLVNGEIAENTTQAILNNSEINGFSLDWILVLKNPEAQIRPAYEYGKESEFYDDNNGLSNYAVFVAKKLKKYATEMLQGDFSAFSKLDEMVKKQYKEYYANRDQQ